MHILILSHYCRTLYLILTVLRYAPRHLGHSSIPMRSFKYIIVSIVTTYAQGFIWQLHFIFIHFIADNLRLVMNVEKKKKQLVSKKNQ